ncbi:MAG: alanine:cation symporter family protein [Muribaculaceae bacterium]|nr:alanine:cation symporter family protein [Muribaculaceae bacterium]
METLHNIATAIASALSDYTLVPLLLVAAIYFTLATRGVQFRMIGEMLHLLIRSGKRPGKATHGTTVSSFQAFAVSIASRVGTGNLAGVASAIAIGGPGAVFWMWIIALLGAASAFAESTLAQLFKIKGKGSYMGGPAYYILKGLHNRTWAITFAILITLTFGFAFNSVQSNTIAGALHTSFGLDPVWVGISLALLTLIIISGGIGRISRFSEIIVPVMAIAYIILALAIVLMNIHRLPEVIGLIVENAFGFNQALGGTVGTALIMGIKRGLFSNEAGEGSTPNAAATADVSHPVKQGLIQALGVYTDTLVICSCTAFIILCSGLYLDGHDGIILTQHAIDTGLGGDTSIGSTFVSIAIFFFAFTSIVANYYYGETNLRFIHNDNRIIAFYRLLVTGIIFWGAISSLDLVWTFADVTMALMTLCNLAAIIALRRYVLLCLADYRRQLPYGDPEYRRSTIPQIEAETTAWPE